MNIQRSWFSIVFVFLASPFVLFGQRLDPILWTLSTNTTKVAPGATLPLQLTAKMQDGWHLYSLTTPKGGPIPTTVALAESPAVKQWVLYQPKPVAKIRSKLQFGYRDVRRRRSLFDFGATESGCARR